MNRRNAMASVVAAMTGGVLGTTTRGHTARGQTGGGTQSRAVPARTRPSFIEANDGTRLFYRDSGTGLPIVFVAPWALCSDWWDHAVTAMTAQGFRCVTYDRRGHGRSDEPGRGYDFDTLADDLAAVIGGLEVSNVLLVGHSMGAAEVVRYLTRDRSGRVTRAVLVAPTTPFILRTADNPDGAPRDVLEQGRERLMQDRPGQIAQAAAAFFGAPGNPVSQATMDWWTRMILDRCSMKVMVDLHRVFTETDFRPELPLITVPTLIVHGDADTSARLDFTGRRTHHLIKSSTLHVYEGAAHGLAITHAERLHADLAAFARQGSAI